MAKPIIKGNLKDSDKVSLTYNGRVVDMTIEDFKLVMAPVPTYKVYRALLTQSGTSAPVPTVLENTLGVIAYTFSGTGDFTATSSGLFIEGKTTVQLYLGSIAAGYQAGTELAGDSAIILTTTNASNAPQNILLSSEEGSWIEIRIYN